MLLSGAGNVWAEDTLFYTLDGTQTYSGNESSSYASAIDIEQDDITWSVMGNTNINPWRIGGKSLDKVDRTVYSKTAMDSAISNVALTVGEASSITVNSLKLIVASDANFSNKIDEVSATFEAKSTIYFTPTSGTEWATGAYYKFIFNVTVSGSKNKFVEFTKAEFYKNGGGETPTVAAPTFSRESGAVAYNTEITISQADDYLITYTTDGTDPTIDSPTYGNSANIRITNISGSTTIKAIAFDNSDPRNASSIATATYTVIHPNAPTFSPAAGAVEAGTKVSITAENGYRIIYTTNGDDPSYDSSVGEVYTDPITIDAETTIKAIAVNIVDASKNIGIESPIATASYTIYDPNAPGTENNPYTVAQALGATPADNVYVQGTISTITEVSTGFGNATYKISDDGTTANEMIIYRGKYLNNKAFTSTDQIAVGDVVKVYGNLSNYKGTNQMAQGNYIVTLQGSKHSPEMSFPEESYSATLGETFTAPALTITPNTLTVTYSSSNISVATVNETSGEVTLVAAGETTITATFAGNDDYRSATASYDLTVTDPNAPGSTIDNPYRVQDVIDGTATGNNVYVKGYIVGEYVGNTTAPHTSGFTTDANIAIADKFTTAPTASGSIPVQLSTDDLKNAWGNKKHNGEFITYEVVLKGNVDTYFSVNGIKSTSEVTATGVYVKIASSGKSSYCASDAIELVDGVNAYIVTNVTSTSATMTQLTGAVPANVGIMLVGTGESEYTLPIATEATEKASVSGNLLTGTASGENVQEEAGKTYLALKNGEFVVMNPGTVKPHKAYLSVDSSVIGNNSKLAITYEENNATAINEVQTTKEDGVFYNLNGMRVSAPQKGIYILNGKKIIVK